MTTLYQKAKKEAPVESTTILEAIEFLKKHSRSSFDETVELHIHLGVDPEKSDQLVRGSVKLPSGTPKQQKIVVFTEDSSQQDAAKEAGADEAGGEDLIKQISETGSLDADITIATPSMMQKIARVAKILGPKGLMPNPKTGTVTENPAEVVTDLRSGKFQFKMDQLGNIHIALGKASWETEKLEKNIDACLDAVRSARPTATKGEFIKTITLASTMSPGVRVKV